MARGRPAAEMAGDKIGRLTVLRQSDERTLKGMVRWVCRCDCGNETVVTGTELRRRAVTSCGCFARDGVIARNIARGDPWFPKDVRSIWSNMIARCDNPKHPSFHQYGGRGIVVCDRWRESYWHFYADIGPRPSPRHSLDRIDRDGNYEPGNVRWGTWADQSRNKVNNVLYEMDGRSMILKDWAAELSLHEYRLRYLVRDCGVPLAEAVATIRANPKRTPKRFDRKPHP